MSEKTVVLPVTVNGITRDVTFTAYNEAETRYWSKFIFTARLGKTGSKTHSVSMMVVECQDKAQGLRYGYSEGRKTLVELDGKWYGLKFDCTVLNRHAATITGWREDAEATSNHTREHK